MTIELASTFVNMKHSTSKEAAFICFCFKIFLVGKRGIRPLISFLHLFSVYKKILFDVKNV